MKKMKFTAEGKYRNTKINQHCQLQALKAPNIQFML